MNCGTDVSVFSILEQLDCQRGVLTGVVYRLAPEYNNGHVRCLHVLHSIKLIKDYLSRDEYDMIVLPCLEHHLPIVWSKAEMGWVKNTEDLADCIAEHWKSELLIISVS